jgi:hypothetical protein
VAGSPVLSGLELSVRCLRGRFYVERSEGRPLARITPLADTLLLEVETLAGNWSEVARGDTAKLMQTMADDTTGRFHGLGALDRSLKKAGQGLTRQPVTLRDDGLFRYQDSGEICTLQEVLFHYFSLPPAVIAEPRSWYRFHRTPTIVEMSADRTRVLVRFSGISRSGQSFGGSCLYALKDGAWGAYPIKPSESGSIKTAEAWLVKRDWKAWN